LLSSKAMMNPTIPIRSLKMPTFVAVFFSIHRTPAVVGIFTTEEFLARCNSSSETAWAYLINSATGNIVNEFRKPDVSEKTA
jgi:hypothetical protein